MRLFITTTVAALAIAGAASAQDAKPAKASAAKGQYISVAGGFVGKSDYDYTLLPGYKLKADADTAAQGVLAWGTQLEGNWRVELALGYHSQDVEAVVVPNINVKSTGSVKTLTLDMNAYYDLPVKGPVKPYVGVGFGAASVKFDDGLLDDRGSGLALPAMAGASVAITPAMSLFAEGRYERVGSMKVEVTAGATKTKSSIDMSGPSALVGVRFGF
ncbi:MAG: porin family protein [Gemmatimonadaceae bacterium]|nr:porin family protein [Caulobacter sp.]